MGRISETVKVLLIVNILFFIGTISLGEQAYDLFALHYPANEKFQFWQLVTHMFMHGGTTHIFLNMFMLYMFGSILEFSLGQNKFLFIYFSAGFGAAGLQLLFLYVGYQDAIQTLQSAGITLQQIQESQNLFLESGRYYIFNNVPPEVSEKLISNFASKMVGASGAVFGVMAAFAVLYPNMPLYLIFIPIPIKAKYLIGAYFVFDLYSAASGNTIIGPSNVAHWAHVGGAIIGFLVMWYWKKNSFNQNRWN
tara:strand:+ start:10151 stop:10903 length:753 start_codon:yes stop_codon:yes gene_type:complete